MYKIKICSSNEQVLASIPEINKERGIIKFVNVDKYAMYIIYEVPDHGSDV